MLGEIAQLNSDTDTPVTVLDAREVHSILQGQERRLMDLVRDAYLIHARGDSCLPHSSFLNFPGKARERIISLPAYLGGEFAVAGMKWIASFPDNAASGLDRASAVIVINSMRTGRPEYIMDGTIISARRTAASAALAASVLPDDFLAETSACFIGCGVINFEIARFIGAANPALRRFIVHDVHPEKAALQRKKLLQLFPDAEVLLEHDLQRALASSKLICFATTAIEPFVGSLESVRPGATILHISLRDIAPRCILACDNIADDIDHVCRAKTSAHLAEQSSGSRSFIRGTLADVLGNTIKPRSSENAICIFNPFGLGILDMAVAQWVAQCATRQQMGTRVPMFMPIPNEPVLHG